MLAFRFLCWRRCLSRCLLCPISDNPTADNPLPYFEARERQNAPYFLLFTDRWQQFFQKKRTKYNK